MSNLGNQLVTAERDDVAKGIRLLLGNPLLTTDTTPDALDLVRRRRDPIGKWFEYYCGWALTVEPRLGYARLHKVRAASDPRRPARRLRSGRAPFDRRRYVLLCVVAAELLPTPVTTVGLLADRVARATVTDTVLADFDTANRSERMAFVDVLRLLESYGVLHVSDGSTEDFVDSDRAKVLYRVDSTLLMRLLGAPVGLAQLDIPVDEVPLRFEELLTTVTTEHRYGVGSDGTGPETPMSDTQRNLWLRHSVFRRLVDDPVLYFDDLTSEQRAYLASPTGRQLLRRATDEAGFVLEERAEGVMFVDPDAIATDTKFPDDSGNAKVAALLLLDAVTGSEASSVSVEQLHREADQLLTRFPKWAKSYRGDDGAAQLARDAVEVLDSFDLVRIESGLVHLLPAAQRYALGRTRTSTDGQNQEVPS